MKHILNISVLLILLVSLFAFRVDAEAPDDQRELTVEETVAHYAYINNVDQRLVLSMMKCESEGKQGAVGDGTHAVGIFQYWPETWNRHSNKYGKKLDRNSFKDQAELATWAVANGMGREWTSYRAIMNGGSYTFFYKLQNKKITVYCDLI